MVFSSCKNEHGGLYFLLHYFGVQIIAFKLEKLKKNINGKKDIAKSVHEARYSILQIMIF